MNDMEFDFALDDGRIARCWQAEHQEYSDCTFSAGLVSGLGVDTLYFRLKHHTDPDRFVMLFLRPDEMLAMQYVIAGALWSERMGADEQFVGGCHNGMCGASDCEICGPMQREYYRRKKSEEQSND
jgi:hypothetical protein